MDEIIEIAETDVVEVAEEAKSKGGRDNTYPYQTKREIAARLESDYSYAEGCLLVLWRAQTAYEQESKTTREKNHRGFMSSHAVWGCKLAEKIVAGESLTAEEQGRVSSMVARYTRQLAAHFRAEANEQNPELATKAAAFFTAQ